MVFILYRVLILRIQKSRRLKAKRYLTNKYVGRKTLIRGIISPTKLMGVGVILDVDLKGGAIDWDKVDREREREERESDRRSKEIAEGIRRALCFVATACYGVDDATTETLRLWRDRQKNVPSVLFIKAYYAGIGKAGAKIIQKFPILKPFARKAIKAFMWIFRIS